MLLRNLVLSSVAYGAFLITVPAFAQTTDETEVNGETETVEQEAPMEETETTTLQDLVDADPNLEMVEGEDDAMVMLADILFPFGSATLSSEAIESLTSLAAEIDEYPTVEIYGYTDSIGSDDANLALGMRRAEAVRSFLVENSKMTDEQVLAFSKGETEPAAANLNEDGTDNPEGRALNRRVVFVFPGM